MIPQSESSCMHCSTATRNINTSTLSSFIPTLPSRSLRKLRIYRQSSFRTAQLAIDLCYGVYVFLTHHICGYWESPIVPPAGHFQSTALRVLRFGFAHSGKYSSLLSGYLVRPWVIRSKVSGKFQQYWAFQSKSRSREIVIYKQSSVKKKRFKDFYFSPSFCSDSCCNSACIGFHELNTRFEAKPCGADTLGCAISNHGMECITNTLNSFREGSRDRYGNIRLF